MGIYKIKKGLDLPLIGEPEQKVSEGKPVSRIAILGRDFTGMKPTMLVQVGDKVRKGQVVFTDKKTPGIKYTAPGSGTVVEINRGEKRMFLSLVIELEGDEEVTFKSYSEAELDSLNVSEIKEQLIESGAWVSLRARPFSNVANPENIPHSIFVTAMDTEPHAPKVSKVLEGKENHFKNGLKIIAKLTEGKVYLCKSPDESIPTVDLPNLHVEEFEGPHPAGLVGTHIHFLDPVSLHKVVWHISAQDVAMIGELFATGKLNVERIISVAGPRVKNPRLVKTRIGADIEQLMESETEGENNRMISGSVLSGRHAKDVEKYLGRYHRQVSVIREGNEKKFLGWLTLGADLFSVKPVLISALFLNKKFDLSTSLNGGVRPIIPIGSYEKVMPLDILPTFLLRALAVKDIEEAEQLGALELDEEDLALCTFVSPSKNDYGVILRENLNIIQKEG